MADERAPQKDASHAPPLPDPRDHNPAGPRRGRLGFGLGSERIFSLLLWAYPSGFRLHYGREMRLAFRSRLRSVSGAAPWTWLRFWFDTLADLVRAAPAQHLDAWGERLCRIKRRVVSTDQFLKTYRQEVLMIGRKVFGLGLVLFASGNFVYDAFSKNNMGLFAILLMTVAASVGAVMLARKG